ncbi:MAG: TetR/AcrR family transcriptional regulator [Gordonia sp. (in: high G+C Gram-positive bacteria)]
MQSIATGDARPPTRHAQSAPAQPADAVMAGGTRLRRTATAKRQASYDDEVRTLIAATQTVIRRNGRSSTPRLADILTEAGMSNQAFYRHFRSRDDVIVATYEQGLLRIHDYLARQVTREHSLRARLTAWINGLLVQIDDPQLAALSSAIIWNVGQIARGDSHVEPVGHHRILLLLQTILAEGAVADPARTARLIQTLVFGTMTSYLESGERPTAADRAHLLEFCLSGALAAPLTPIDSPSTPKE